MGMLFVIVFLGASSWALASLVGRLRRSRAGGGWWLAFGLLAATGIAVGIWCGFAVEYHLGARYRVASFPLPVVFFHLEGNEWVDYPVPLFQAWATAFTNVVAMAALATLPLWPLSRLLNRHEHTTA